MSVTSGDSLANTGMSYRRCPRTAAITLPDALRVEREDLPGVLGVGAGDVHLDGRHPGRVGEPAGQPGVLADGPPAIETTVRAPRWTAARAGRARRNASMPGPCRPTEFSMPLGVSAMPRGRAGRPGFGHDRLADQRADPGHVEELGQLTARAARSRTR